MIQIRDHLVRKEMKGQNLIGIKEQKIKMVIKNIEKI
jgi:hypothetical protein